MRRACVTIATVFAALALGVIAIAIHPVRLLANLRESATHDERHSVMVSGVQRNYLLHVPTPVSPNNPAPLVLVFHGGGGHDWNMPGFTHFDDLADAQGFFVAYPDSTNRHWNDGRGESDADDVAFTRALIDDVEHSHTIDSRRVYATGISNGGFFSNRLACELTDKIAAIVSIAAPMPKPLDETCKPSRPISVMYIQGTEDPLVPIDGGKVGFANGQGRGENISLDASARFWCKVDKISAPPEITNIPDLINDGTHVQRKVWTNGADHTEVVVYVIDGGGHTWPGAAQYLPKLIVGKASQNLDATRTIWNFFKTRSLPGN